MVVEMRRAIHSPYSERRRLAIRVFHTIRGRVRLVSCAIWEFWRLLDRHRADVAEVAAVFDRRSQIPAILERLEEDRPECVITAPVWHGLTSECRPYDQAAATWHGEERARLEALGRPAPFVDGQIAAIARVNGLVLATQTMKTSRASRG